MRFAYGSVTGVSDGSLFYEKPFTVTVTDVAETPGGSGGGGVGPAEEPGNPPETPAPTAPAADNPVVEVIVNGDRQNQLAIATVEDSGGQRTIVVTLDPDKIASRLGQEGAGAVITIPVTAQADKVAGELNGAIVKLMEGKQAVLVIDTGSASYTLPAAQINIDDVSKLFGEQLSLADIRVRVEISAASAEQSGLLNRTAGEQAFTPIVAPVNFTVTATYNGETVEIKTFTAYVEREIKLPDGIDPSKITTGIVINADGTITHVPTYIVERDGKWYARINSLTNSPYSVIWNPQSFADTERHWARGVIDDMASRKVVNGVGSGKYEPDLSITRAEFAAIVVRALGLGDNGGSSRFGDVKIGDWYFGVVSKAWEYGLIEGFEDGTFQPGQMITREQAMVMLRKAMKLAGLQTAVQNAERVLAPYPDSNQIAPWAKDSVAAAVSAGLVQGRESGIEPKQTITRAETAKLVYELLVGAKLIDKKDK
ncbi:MAG: inlA [Paenibacillus sp.]|nr:inlA [Paenibacillus sp.]